LEKKNGVGSEGAKENETGDVNEGGEYDSEEESAPPEFDLRTGRYVSHSRPMRSGVANVKDSAQTQENGQVPSSSTALTKRANGDIAAVGGVASPGAEYLRSKRTWQGLGSDYRDEEEEGRVGGNAAKMEEGRSGIARGYVVGDEERRH
jgi:diphthamide biosynthesis protein 2